MNRRSLPSTAFFDADNTLYDWIHYFSASLRALVYELSGEVTIPMPRIQSELRTIFRRHGTVEYPFYLSELASLLSIRLSRNHVRRLQEAQDFRVSRALRAYPGVLKGLAILRDAGVSNVCVSDASRCHVLYRMDHLNMLGCFDAIYCSPDYPVDEPFQRRRREGIRRILEKNPNLRVEQFPVGLRKPAPELLPRVLGDLSVDPRDCVFLGDNLSKDIAMAKLASVFDCWASYGLPRLAPDVSFLVSVTDWSPEDVEKFYMNRPEKIGIRPSLTAESFEDFAYWVLRHWDSRRYEPLARARPRQLALLDVPNTPV
jgi:FMN phosphatase YigB (HAD superfamily)